MGNISNSDLCIPIITTFADTRAVLSALDAKIELNQRLNSELEGLAKLLYDYWFVQYDFPLSPAQAALRKPHLTENAIRPTKLGHKNWMFIGGDHTGWRSAVIYTFVEQVRRHGADPFGYFEWVFEKLMHNPPEDQLEDLLPANWLKTRPAACQTIESRVA